jgi:gamma-glutamyltranspeptidase/glutathione hydrolase
VLAVAALLGAPAAAGAAGAAAKQPTATGRGGAVATVDHLATQAATRILRDGGNAVDAAVGAAAVLGVTEPYSCGIGGGGFMLLRDADRGRVSTIEHREVAPAAMRPDSFFAGGTPLKFDDARWSGLSAGAPGTVAGWEMALRKHGSMTLAQVLQPAIRVARRGFVVDQTFFDQTLADVPWFDDVPSTRALYLDADGTPRDVGTRIRNPDLARTYELIARKGARGFYRGPVARAIAGAVARPPIDAAAADHVWRPGLLTTADLRGYRAKALRPTQVRYRGLDVYGMAPPSSGGSTVGEALNILEGFDMKGADEPLALHRFLESTRLAFADRGAYVADPSFAKVPLAGLLSDQFAAQRRALIGPKAAASPVAPGTPPGAQATTAAAPDDQHPRQSTTNLTVADADGNVVVYTFTIESTGGNGIVVPGYGFLLNNELTDFDFDKPRAPNRPEAGKRPRSSIAPTLVERAGKPVLAVGAPGGATIITTVLQILVERLDRGLTLPQAIAAPRASQRNAAATEAEPAFIASPAGRALASQHGQTFKVPTASPEIGAATGIEFLRGGRLQAAAEPVRRGGGSAAVVRRR